MMLNEALLDALHWRYAVKKFNNETVSGEQLRQLLGAVRLTASSYGLQPYRVIVVESAEIKNALLPHAYGQAKVAENSQLLILAAYTGEPQWLVERYIKNYCQITGSHPDALQGFADQAAAYLNDMHKEQRLSWANEQAYIALGNLLTTAALMKIDCCPMAGFSREGFDKVLGLKGHSLTATVICPIGYRHQDDSSALQPKVRLGYNDIVMEL